MVMMMRNSWCLGLALILVVGCSRQERPVDPKVDPSVVVAPPAKFPDPEPDPLKGVTTPSGEPVPLFNVGADPANAKYEAALTDALTLLADQKLPQALEAFESAQALKDTAFVRDEIARLKFRVDQETVAKKTYQEIEAVLEDGKAPEAAKLVAKALQEFGDRPGAEKFVQLQVQAEALLSAETKEAPNVRFVRLRDEGQAALRDQNLRAATLAFEQALQIQDDAGLRDHLSEVQGRLQNYDGLRKKASELRRDPAQVDEALDLLREAAKAWDTPQIRQDIDDCQLAIQKRRDTLSVADFEVHGNVGIGDAGDLVADHLLPHFKARFDLVERDQIAKVMKELNLQADQQINGQQQQEVGKLARVRYLVLGTVGRLGDVYAQARLVDVRTGFIVQTGKISAPTIEQLLPRLPELSRQLLMSDEERFALEQEQLRVAKRIEQVPENAPLPEFVEEKPKAMGAMFEAAPPPAFGGLQITQFQALPPAPAVLPTVIIAEPPPVAFRHRLLVSSLQMGDGFFVRGNYREAYRQYEFALSLAPGNFDISMRLERCRPLLAPPPLFMVGQPVVLVRPRIVLMNFLTVGDPRVVPPILGNWAASYIVPYFAPTYDIADAAEVYWMMARLGMTQEDLMNNPSARRWLGRAMNIQYFVLGTIQQTASFNVNTYLMNAEHGWLQGAGMVHAHNPLELKLRAAELAQMTQMPPAQRTQYLAGGNQFDVLLTRGQDCLGRNDFRVAVTVFEDALRLRPGNVQVMVYLNQARGSQHRWEIEEARRQEALRQQATAEAARRRQWELGQAAEAARIRAAQEAGLRAEAERRIAAQQRANAYGDMVAKARIAIQGKNFGLAVNLFQGALDMAPQPVPFAGLKPPPPLVPLPVHQDVLLKELALARAEANRANLEKAQSDKLAAQEAFLRQQREKELVIARQKIQDDQRKVQADAQAQRILIDTKYQAAFDQGQLLMSQGKYEAAIVALQGARQLKKTEAVEAMLTTALGRQAEHTAKAKGEPERIMLETKLIEERKRRKAAEDETKRTRELYEASLKSAQDALAQKNFDVAQAEYQAASKYYNTDAVLNGLKRVNTLRSADLAAKNAAKDKAEAGQRVTQLLNGGKIALDAGHYAESLHSLEQARKIDPSNVEVIALLARVQQANDRALADMRRKNDDADRVKNFDRLVAGGQQNLKNKNYQAAIVALGEALKLKEDAAVRAALDHARQEAATSNVSAKTAEAEKQKAQDYQKLLNEGRIALSTKRYDAAHKAFEGAQKLMPGDKASAEFMQEALKSKQAAQEALVAAANEKAGKIKLQDDFRQALLEGQAAIRGKNFEVAQKALDRANTLIPGNPQAVTALRDLDQAKQQGLEEIQTKKKSAAFMQSFTQGQKLLAGKNYEQAVKSLQEALAVQPGEPQATQLLQQAQSAWQAAKNAEAGTLRHRQLLQQGQLFVSQKKFAEAIPPLQEAIKLDPQDKTAPALLQQAQTALENLRAEQAQELKRKIGYGEAFQAGQRLLSQKKYAEALQAFQAAKSIYPADPQVNLMLNQTSQAWEASKKLDVPPQPKVDPFPKLPEIKKEVPPLPKPKIDPLPKPPEIKKETPIPPKIIIDPPPKVKVIPQPKPPEVKKELPKPPTPKPIIDPPPKVKTLVPPAEDPAKQKAAADRAAYQKHMADGQQAFVQRRFPDAVQSFEAALRFAPGDAMATKLLQAAKGAKK